MSDTQKKWLFMGETFLISLVGGYCFYLLKTPIPWTLGPLFATLLWQRVAKRNVSWSLSLRNLGLLVVGYSMGCFFTPESSELIFNQLPFMLVVTTLTIGVSIVTAYITHRMIGTELISTIMGSLPGGIQQMAVLCDDIPKVDLNIVTFMQTTRLLATVFVVPFLAIHGFSDGATSAANFSYTATLSDHWPYFLLGVPVMIFLATILRMPSPYLFGAVLSTAFLITMGYEPPRLPSYISALGQLCVGISIGVRIRPVPLPNWKQLSRYSLMGVAVLLLFSFLFAEMISLLQPVSLVSAFLATAPGGLAEMSITAMGLQEDVAFVLAYQFFRVLFLLTVVAPLLKYLLVKREKKIALRE